MTDTPNSDAQASSEAGLSAVAAVLREQQAQMAQESRRLRRRVFRWRLLALILLIGVAIGAFLGEEGPTGANIARVEVSGVITDDRKRDAMFADIAEDTDVKAVIVRIDSPGGTTVGGEALYESLRAVAAKKPVVGVMGEVAASAAYITALATDHVVARGNTITASVGVIFTAPNFYKAIDALGVEVVEVKSGEHKAEPSPYKSVDQIKVAAERVLVNDSFQWFLDLVRERRQLDPAVMAEIRDGRILTGRMALERRLVDEIGGEEQAVAWLQAERGIDKGLPIVDREPDDPKPGLLARIVDNLFGGSKVLSAVGRLQPGPQLMSTLD